jgi:hypothetical protein
MCSPPGETRRDDAILSFKALAGDTGGLLSVSEFSLGAWEPGPVLAAAQPGLDPAAGPGRLGGRGRNAASRAIENRPESYRRRALRRGEAGNWIWPVNPAA